MDYSLGRNETYTDGCLRVGDFKLIVSNPDGRGRVGTGGGWIRPATNVTDPYPNRNKMVAPVDDFLKHGCNRSRPCLFRVAGDEDEPWSGDAEERHNLAQAMPELVARMTARWRQIEATQWSPPRPVNDTGRACDVMMDKYGGQVIGPWQNKSSR